MSLELLRKISPAPCLQHLIASYTVIDIPQSLTQNFEFLVLPSSRTRMILFTGRPSFQKINSQIVSVESYSLTGLYSKPQLFLPNQSVKQIMIEFYPWSIQSLLDFPLAEITDTRADLRFIFRDKLENLLIDLQISDLGQIKSVLDTFFKMEFKKANKFDQRARHIFNLISSTNGTLKLNQLSSELFVSERTAQRLVHNYLGVNYKFFSKLVRLEYVRKLLSKGNMNLTDVALKAGYFDQSHFNHEFLHGFGETPRSYQKKHQKLIWNQIQASTMADG